MTFFLNRIATPFTLALFAISAISGVALFFHIAQGAFHSMHEWLSMVLLAPFIFHVWKNWGALKAYFRRGALWIPLVASLAVAIAFAVPGLSSSGGRSPMRAALLMTQTPLNDLAPVLKTTPEALKAALSQRGYKIESGTETFAELAASSGAQPIRLLLDILPSR